ncbi:hypothetical protein K457DRAFT_17128 [Linnemannia elongata AG-77]|uniref:MEIOB-like N-terminal domain-containing protein n=1 Tax=Linnemannia elongata AG-77 TaxID=1314771 RepID=A0A197K5U6_9FUNG|nr:hypothetical protein K457DRAFT_17128 [Linnemannia elongata AG-77]
MHRQKTPYSRPIPTSGHTAGGPDGSANNSSYLTAASRERQAPPLPPDLVKPYSNYTLNSPQISQPSPYQPYSQQQRPAVATYSAQAMRTFAPQQQFPVVTPEAAMVPIRSLQPEKSFVRVSGRTVRAPDIKAFPNKWDSSKQTWLMSFTIKDDCDTIDVKFWHKTQEHLQRYSHLTLDQVVHVWTDEVKLISQVYGGGQSSYAPTTSSPLVLNLGEGKIGHKIEVGSEVEMETLYKVALGSNLGGVIHSIPMKQVFNSLGTIKSQRFNLVVCVKKLISSGVINSKNGPLVKTCYTIFDAQGQEASLTMWGETMAEVAQRWIPGVTTMVITGAQASMYSMKPQITIGYQTHIQVDPICKNIEWLKHFASQTEQEVGGGGDDDVSLDHIQTSYHIIDLSQLIDSMKPLDVNYGFTFAVLCELDIDTTASDVLTAQCPLCHNAINSFKIEACSTCNVAPNGDNMWHYSLTRYISFMDDTAELRHPSIASSVVEDFLGFSPGDFSSLSLTERAQLKKRVFLERFKVHFKIAWSESKKQHIVEILAMSRALLSEIDQINKSRH